MSRTYTSPAAKAAAYLAAGRLEVRHVDPDGIAGVCRGDGAWYQLGHDGRGWWCTCPASGTRCAHLIALRLVVTRTRDPLLGADSAESADTPTSPLLAQVREVAE